MKKFILKASLFIGIILSINLVMGFVRLQLKDEITYRRNQQAKCVTINQYVGRADTQMYLKTVTDLRLDSIALPLGIHRIYDAYGFSNAFPNKAPKILFIGDSFLDDPHIATDSGIQASCDKALHQHLSYNIGGHNCSGFAVYNDLMLRKAFTDKPKLIVLETVERYLHDNITDAYYQLLEGKLKSNHDCYFGMDLLFGNNFKDLRESKYFYHAAEAPRFGQFSQIVDKDTVWFLRNKLSQITTVEHIVQLMQKLKQLLEQQNIQIVYVIAPDKESLYPQFFGASQLDTIQKVMHQEGIPYIDIYTQLKGNPLFYYYNSDTHWNGNAIKLLGLNAAQYYKEHCN